MSDPTNDRIINATNNIPAAILINRAKVISISSQKTKHYVNTDAHQMQHHSSPSSISSTKIYSCSISSSSAYIVPSHSLLGNLTPSLVVVKKHPKPFAAHDRLGSRKMVSLSGSPRCGRFTRHLTLTQFSTAHLTRAWRVAHAF